MDTPTEARNARDLRMILRYQATIVRMNEIPLGDSPQQSELSSEDWHLRRQCIRDAEDCITEACARLSLSGEAQALSTLPKRKNPAPYQDGA